MELEEELEKTFYNTYNEEYLRLMRQVSVRFTSASSLLTKHLRDWEFATVTIKTKQP